RERLPAPPRRPRPPTFRCGVAPLLRRAPPRQIRPRQVLLDTLAIAEWSPDGPRSQQDLEELSSLFHASVHAGASVSFILPFSLDDARAFWRTRVLPGVIGRSRILL